MNSNKKAIFVLAGLFFAVQSLAQSFPARPVTLLVTFPAGGPTDIEGRIIAHHLPAHIPGKPNIIVKNMGGAGGMIGAEVAARAPARMQP